MNYKIIPELMSVLQENKIILYKSILTFNERDILLNIYNQTFNTKETHSTCASCWRSKQAKLIGVLVEYVNLHSNLITDNKSDDSLSKTQKKVKKSTKTNI